MMYTFENWLNGCIQIESSNFLYTEFPSSERVKILEESKQIVLREAEYLAKQLYEGATSKDNKDTIEETLRFNKETLEKFVQTVEFANIQKAVVDCYLPTPRYIPQSNLYFSILTTNNLIKLLEKHVI